jgi:hypothetical protein
VSLKTDLQREERREKREERREKREERKIEVRFL